MRDFPRRLINLRLELGISQTALGRIVGRDQSTVSVWERGKSLPPADLQRDIIDALRAEVAKLAVERPQ